ncbi:MAG: o-succinylbenzoate--CoA ligase [Anaerolineae bacterium]|nr:o-succinylbenzoate--CoA ligase [Anaerolineae bacterium]MDW8170875.1 o-succinylbenzoate--CoA ligase [Anaerolineae bacterium]
MEDWLAARARSRPEGLALLSSAQARTFRQWDAEAALMAARLRAVGVRTGQRVPLLLPNGFAYACAIFALWRVGAVPVPLNLRLSASELAWQLGHLRASLLLVSAETYPLAREAAAGLHLLDIGDNVSLDVDSLSRYAPQEDPGPPRPFDPQADALWMFTSGTSGKPKAARLSFNNLFTSALASAYTLGLLPQDRWLCLLPFYHIGGLSLLTRCCLYGCTLEFFSKFDAEAVNAHLHAQPVTLVSLVPTQLWRMLEVRGQRQQPQALRLVLLGGAAASPDLMARAQTGGVRVATTYGLTEAASQVATALPHQAVAKPSSVGKPLIFTHVSIADEEGQPLPAGQHGEIVVRGPTVMQGYADDDIATARALRDGALHTGDMGYLDEDGDLFVLQRRSDLIVSGGENVYPSEVEAVLGQHPAVAEVIVVGAPDPEWGQVVCAAIVLRPDHNADAADILAFSRQRLAGYKQPRRLRFVAELPRNPLGKILRSQVVDWFHQRHD